MLPAPTSDFVLHLVEQPIHLIQATRDFLPVALMFFVMNVLGRIEHLVGGAIRFGKSRIVPVVVMQVQTQLIHEPF